MLERLTPDLALRGTTASGAVHTGTEVFGAVFHDTMRFRQIRGSGLHHGVGKQVKVIEGCAGCLTAELCG